jgi:predicted XRE-type DNA-binding protein
MMMTAAEKLTHLKMFVARKIKAMAHSERWTQKDLACILSTSQPRVSNLYNGKWDKISLDMLITWAHNLNIDCYITTH